MSRLTDEEFYAQTMARHPERSSLCGALLAEILYGENDGDRITAAVHFGFKRYRRGLRALERLLDGWVPKVEAFEVLRGSPSWYGVFRTVLVSLGMVDVEDSHAILKRYLVHSPSPFVRADAMGGMAFEKKYFEWELVLPYLSDEASFSELLGALYAVEFRNQPRTRQKQVAALVLPLLKHSHPLVRSYSVRVLRFDESNRQSILDLADDPVADVRREVAEAISILDDP